MLTKMDDFPRHQAVETMAHVAVANPSWNDGYWFSAWDASGEIFLFTGMRVYQNVDVMDGYACYTRGGQHVNVRMSQRYSPNYDELAVGPLRYEILEGMRLRRLQLDAAGNPGKFSFDLRWEAIAPPHEESRRTQRIGGRISLDIIRYWQIGRVTGRVQIDGQEIVLPEAGWCGGMDHSWGLRPIMGPKAPTEDYPPVPPLPAGQDGLFRLAALFEFPAYSGFFHTHEDASGQIEWFEGRLDFRDGTMVEIVKVEHEFHYHPACRRFERGRYILTDATGKRWEHEVVPTHDPIEPRAIGYFPGFKDGRGTGVYRGEMVVEDDVWSYTPQAVIDPQGSETLRNGHVGPAHFREGTVEGRGYFEHLLIGSCRRYGFVADGPVPGTVIV